MTTLLGGSGTEHSFTDITESKHNKISTYFVDILNIGKNKAGSHF